MSFLLVLAQAAAVSTPVAATPAQGVTNYPAAYFADFHPSTALDMVRRLPGFTFDTGDSVRGFEGAAGNVLIDGARPASKSDTLDSIVQRIPASQVDHIEVIRGGAPGVDMQGKSVLANIVRKKGGGFVGLVQLNDKLATDKMRNYPGLRLEGSGKLGAGSWEGSWRSNGGFDDGIGPASHLVLDPQGVVSGRSDIDAHGEVYQHVATAAYERPLAGGKFRINGRGFYEHYRFNEFNRFTFPTPDAIANDDGQERIQSELGLRYDKDLSPRLKLELVGLRQTDDADYHSNATLPRDDYNYFQTTFTTESIGRGVLKFRRNDRLSFEAGSEVAYNTLDNDTGLKVQGAPVALPAPQVEVQELRGELFGKVVWVPRTHWNVEAGLRGEASKITGESKDGLVDVSKTLYYPKPRLLVSWEPRTGSQVRLRFEREVGQLDFNDFVSSASLNEGVLRAGNVNLVPEQEWITEVSFEQRFWKSGAIVLTFSHSAIDDTIDRAPIRDPAGVFDAPANIGKGTDNSVQMSLNLPLERFGLKHGEFRGELELERTRVTDPTTGEKRSISGRRLPEWEAHYSQQLPKLKTEIGADVFGGWKRRYYRFNEITTDKLRTYVVLYAQWKPKDDLTFRAEVQNATARGFHHVRTIYEGPRDAFPVLLVDDREAQIGPIINVSIRKNFGG